MLKISVSDTNFSNQCTSSLSSRKRVRIPHGFSQTWQKKIKIIEKTLPSDEADAWKAEKDGCLDA